MQKFGGSDVRSPARRVAASIQERIQSFSPERGLRIGNELIHASAALETVYERGGFQPLWSDGERLLPAHDELLSAIRDAHRQGLDPLDYHYDRIVNVELAAEHRGITPGTELLADLDLLLTDAFLLYGTHLISGAVNPATIDPDWSVERRDIDIVSVLERAVDAGRIAESLEALAPSQPQYRRLRELLSRYRARAEEPPISRIGAGSSIKPGERDRRVLDLRRRVAMVLEPDEAPAAEGDEEVYDDPLAEAVRRIQKRYGLYEDGVVGGATREALNRDPSEVVEQIEANMERWRWLPENLGARYLLVNIAGFDLEAKSGTDTELSMRVVVGRPYRQTPVFASRVTHVVLNPSWTVPETIVKEDVLPAVRKDTGYLEKHHLRVFDGWTEGAPEMDPRRIEWRSVAPLRYRFRQDPGPWNALGRVKFLLPNPHDVYLHDTPERNLFQNASRSFSSGCIRLERPFALLDYLLTMEPASTAEAVREARAAPEERTVKLGRELPIYILYWTAWVDEDENVHFRKDIYGRDARLIEALHARPPREPVR